MDLFYQFCGNMVVPLLQPNFPVNKKQLKIIFQHNLKFEFIQLLNQSGCQCNCKNYKHNRNKNLNIPKCNFFNRF